MKAGTWVSLEAWYTHGVVSAWLTFPVSSACEPSKEGGNGYDHPQIVAKILERLLMISSDRAREVPPGDWALSVV